MPMHSSVVLRKRVPRADYRIHILTFGNKIAGPAVEVDCQSDEEAVAKARTLLNGQDIKSGRARVSSLGCDLRTLLLRRAQSSYCADEPRRFPPPWTLAA